MLSGSFRIKVRTLILQCSEDIIAPIEVGEYLHSQIPGSKLVVMKATGHCPNLSAPDETIAAIRAGIGRRRPGAVTIFDVGL